MKINLPDIKGCLGFEIMPKIEIEGIKFYPKAKKLFETIHTTIESVEFTRYMGKRQVLKVVFPKDFFVHNADALLNITINRTTLKELIHVLSNIAVFMTSRFEITRGRTLKQVRYNCKRYYNIIFYELVGLTENDIRTIKGIIETLDESDMEIEALRFSNNLEI